MTQTELMERMPPKEFFDWWVYFQLEDEEYRKDIDKKIKLEASKEKTDRERADELVAMFRGMMNGNNRRLNN